MHPVPEVVVTHPSGIAGDHREPLGQTYHGEVARPFNELERRRVARDLAHVLARGGQADLDEGYLMNSRRDDLEVE